MKFVFSLKAVCITLLAVIIAMACADPPRQVKKRPTYRGWTKMAESRYGPTVRGDVSGNVQTRAWNSRQRVGKRYVPEFDSFEKRHWNPRPRPPSGKRDWDFLLSPEEINDAFEDAQLIEEAPLDIAAAPSNDVLRDIIDYVKQEGHQK